MRLSKNKLTKMNEICVVLKPQGYGLLMMRGEGETELTKEDLYFGMGISPFKSQQFLSLYENTYNADIQLISGIVDLAEEKIKKLDINDFVQTGVFGGGFFNSSLKISNKILEPVIPSSGMIFTLIGGGDILVNSGLLRRKADTPEADLYDFKDIKNVSVNKVDFNLEKNDYEKWDFCFGFCPISGSNDTIKYEREGKKFCLELDQPPGEMASNAFFKKLIEKRPELKKGYKEDKLNERLNKISRYDDISIIDFMLKRNNIRISDFYFEGPIQPCEAANEYFLNYNKVFLNLEKAGRSKVVEASIFTGLDLSLIHSNSLWVKKYKPPKKEEDNSRMYR